MKIKANEKAIITIIICVLCAVLLTTVYMTNFLDSNNTAFKNFQMDSENLVTGVLLQAVEKEAIGPCGLYDYNSQFGLQGYVFYFLASILPQSLFGIFHLMCAAAMAAVAVAICYEIRKYVDRLLAVIFYLVFLLSPWIINFARNLYWVEFTWFLPMLVGLFFANKRFKNNYIYYILMFATVFIKSLCGYEYLSTILVAAMAFPCLHLLNTFFNDKKSFLKEFKTVFLMGVFALVGVVAALVIHSFAWGKGDIVLGFKSIYYITMYRASWATVEMAEFAKAFGGYDLLAAAINVPVTDVIKTYLNMPTNVLLGVPGILFKFIVVAAGAIATCGAIIKKKITKEFLLYIVFFIASISWFVLSKPHSYVHTHINYVLWYMGYVQICFYTIVKGVQKTIK